MRIGRPLGLREDNCVDETNTRVCGLDGGLRTFLCRLWFGCPDEHITNDHGTHTPNARERLDRHQPDTRADGR